ELGTMYRLERSGELSGLSRVRAMTLNDAHIFCTPEQILPEFKRAVRLIEQIYRDMGFERYNYRLSLRDPNDKEKFVDNDRMWEQSEGALRQALKELDVEYYESVGDAAFYGPKLDVQVANVLGEDGQPHQPVMIHRGGISTLERFMAFLIENYAGAFPLWLAPVQAVVIPISDEKHGAYAEQVAERLRAEVDARHERMNAKVRDAQLQKIPYMLVVGDKEAQADAVAVRLRSNENLGAVPIADFIQRAKQIVAERSQELWSAKQPE